LLSGSAWLLLLVASLATCAAQDDAVDQTGIEAPKVLKDQWERIEIGGVAAGYGRLREFEFVRDGHWYRQTDSVTRLRLRRLGQKVEAVIAVQATEDQAGRLLHFRTETDLGGQPTVTTGRVAGAWLEITDQRGEKSTTERIPWGRDDRGFFYEQRSLEEKPLEPGERRSFSALMPIFHRVARVELVAGKWQKTKILDRVETCLPIQSRTLLKGQPFESTLWMDRQGQILKIEESSLGQTVVRTTRAKALAGQDAVAPDLIVGTVIPLKGQQADLSTARMARYRVKAASVAGGPPFPSTGGQTCRPGKEKGTWDLVVRTGADRPASPEATDASVAGSPREADRRASRLIESEDAGIQRLAGQVPSAATDVALANALTQKVYTWIEQKDFSTVLASAAEVARTRRGDCTEHAVLLAAMARARGLPARVVVGLVYVPQLGGFGYHMWNEMWCDGHWHSFDATRPAGCGGGHIKIADASLDDGSGLAVFLPVLQVMGGTQIELSEFKK